MSLASSRLHRRRLPVTLMCVLLAALAGCTATARNAERPASDPGGAGEGRADELTGELRVFAAASLTDAMEQVGSAFEARHPGVAVVLNLAGSNQLTGQLLEGASADVFASADEVQMDAVVAAGLASAPVTFATNDLQIAVEEGNPRDIGGLAELERDDLVVVLASDAVPAGRYASEALSRAGVTLQPASFEVDVRAALGKVVFGEADAAIVYGSDVAARDAELDGIVIPPAQNVTAEYPIAALDGSANPEAAAAFLRFVQSDAARQLLRDSGFGLPS